MQPLHFARAALQLPFLLKRITGYIASQRSYIKKNIAPLLADAMLKSDGSLDENDIKKITGYYALAVPTVLGEAFCCLRGSPMSDKERWASTCQGAMTGLFDDFFDKDHLEDTIIESKIDQHLSDSRKRSNEKLFDHFYAEVLKNVPDDVLMKKALTQVYHAQVDSKEQNVSITKQRMLSITLNKGGLSLQFYRSAFSHPYKEGEDEFLYKAGGLMQVANDIFDVYKDSKANIRTAVTTAIHINEVRDLFTQLLFELHTSAASLPYKKKNICGFLDIISIGIFSRCFVCLDHLEKNERHTGNVFKPEQYSREQLICDMDTKKNMLRSAAYHLKCSLER